MSSRPQFKRNVDAESRKPRIPSSRAGRSGSSERAKTQVAELTSHKDEELEEVMSELDLSDVDDSVRDPVPKRTSGKKQSKTQIARTSAQRPSAQPATTRTTVQEEETNTRDYSGHDSVPSQFIVQAAIHIPISSITYAPVCTFYPNCWTMFNILGSMHELVAENAYILRVAPNYNTLCSRLYYGILWFIQVLRAKHTCGSIRNHESTFLRAFERMFPFESLVIAGPLVSYFKSLGAVASDDPMYTWICPDLPAELGPAGANTNLKRPHSILYPCVPGIISLLRSIVSSTSILNSHNAGGDFIPFDLATGGTFAGRTIPPTTTTTLINEHKEMLSLPGINKAPEQSLEILRQTQRALARLQIPDVTANVDLSTVARFLLMSDSMAWFKPLTTMAHHEATFFKGSTTLNHIGTTAGLETLVVGETEVPQQLARPTNWYPGLAVPQLATFKTTRGQTTEMDFRMGVLHQINRSVPENVSGHGEINTVNSNDLIGQYWHNTTYQYETPVPVSVQDHIDHIIRTQYFSAKGELSTS